MANTKAAKKAFRVSERKREINRNRKSRYRTFIKKVEDIINSITNKKDGNISKLVEEGKAALKKMESEIMKAVKFDIIKKNAASRKLSRTYKSFRKSQENITTKKPKAASK